MIFRQNRAWPFPLRSLRAYSSAPPAKPPIKLIAELRKLTEVSVTKAREALSASDNDLDAALRWLEKDLTVSGAAKAAKLKDRHVGEGLIGVSILSNGAGGRAGSRDQLTRGSSAVRAAIIELNCETDFVARNELFGKLVADIAHTAAFITEPQQETVSLIRPIPLDFINEAPLISQTPTASRAQSTVASAIRDTIAKVGENISLKRVAAVSQDAPPQPTLGLRIASYAHGSVNHPSQGRIAALSILAMNSPRLATLLASETFRDDLEGFERKLARQIVGFETRTVRSAAGTEDGTALYDQPFMMYLGDSNERPVHDILTKWACVRQLTVEETRVDGPSRTRGLEVAEFAKWAVGES
jgi:elongation factor Ts